MRTLKRSLRYYSKHANQLDNKDLEKGDIQVVGYLVDQTVKKVKRIIACKLTVKMKKKRSKNKMTEENGVQKS